MLNFRRLLPLALPLLLLACGQADKPADDTLTPQEAGQEATTAAPDVTAEADTRGELWAIDNEVPTVHDDAVTATDVAVRANDQFRVFAVSGTTLFEPNTATLTPAAADRLRQVAAAINKNYPTGQIRVYDRPDSTQNVPFAQDLGEQRAAAVKNWLLQYGRIDAARVSVAPPGTATQTTGASADGHRIEIAVRKAD